MRSSSLNKEVLSIIGEISQGSVAVLHQTMKEIP